MTGIRFGAILSSMCGRMVVLIDGVAYYHYFSSQEKGWTYRLAPSHYQTDPDWWRNPREVRPTENVLIHRLSGNEIAGDWGFWSLVPPWIEGSCSLVPTSRGNVRLVPPPRTHFNSRKDTLVKSSGWRRLLKSNRCVILADSFFEWSDTELLAGRPKQVGRFRLNGKRIMPMAGIWSSVRIGGHEVLTASVVTAEPNAQLESLPHHRMPAILLGQDLERWLDPANDHPEEALHATLDEEIEAVVVPSGRYAELL